MYIWHVYACKYVHTYVHSIVDYLDVCVYIYIYIYIFVPLEVFVSMNRFTVAEVIVYNNANILGSFLVLLLVLLLLAVV